MASIYKRGDWWWVKYKQGGRWVYKNLETKNQRDAERAKRDITRAEFLARPTRRIPSANPEQADAWRIYSEWAEQHLRAPTRRIVTYHWEQFRDATKMVHVGDIKQADVEAFKAARLAAGAAPQSVNNALKDIAAVYNRLRHLKAYSGANPVDGVERLRIPRTSPAHHTIAERDKLLEAASMFGAHTRWVVLLGAWAGLRRNEIANARWEWFDWDPSEPKIHVARFDGFELKDREDRTIPMARRIYDELFPFRIPFGFLFSPRQSEGKGRYRFDPKRALMSALKAAKLGTDLPFQKLRHTFGSILAQQGVSIYKIAEWMGHESVSTTRRHYAALQAYDADIESLK